jgi:hypothetical protein
MGYLKDDIRHLRGDLRHIQGDIADFKRRLDGNNLALAPLEELLKLGDFLAHVRDLEAHVNDVLAHIGHVENHAGHASGDKGHSNTAMTGAPRLFNDDPGDSPARREADNGPYPS